MTLERRQAMLDVARRQGVAIIEDDCYVDLRFEGENVPSIASLDGDGVVSYVGSFSKITGPGMRLGYVAASEEMLLRLRPIKSGGGVNQFASWAIHRFAERHLDDHIRKINGVQRVKRDAMLSALGENFGSQAKWSRPDGGLYVWLELQEDADLVDAQDAALEAEVGYQPGPDLQSGRRFREELRPPLLRLQHARRDPRGNRATGRRSQPRRPPSHLA